VNAAQMTFSELAGNVCVQCVSVCVCVCVCVCVRVYECVLRTHRHTRRGYTNLNQNKRHC